MGATCTSSNFSKRRALRCHLWYAIERPPSPLLVAPSPHAQTRSRKGVSRVLSTVYYVLQYKARLQSSKGALQSVKERL